MHHTKTLGLLALGHQVATLPVSRPDAPVVPEGEQRPSDCGKLGLTNGFAGCPRSVDSSASPECNSNAITHIVSQKQALASAEVYHVNATAPIAEAGLHSMLSCGYHLNGTVAYQGLGHHYEDREPWCKYLPDGRLMASNESRDCPMHEDPIRQSLVPRKAVRPCVYVLNNGTVQFQQHPNCPYSGSSRIPGLTSDCE